MFINWMNIFQHFVYFSICYNLILFICEINYEFSFINNLEHALLDLVVIFVNR